MPVFDQKKVSEDAVIWLAIIGLLVILFFVCKTIVRTPPLLLAVAFVTPVIGFIWSKYQISLFDDYEMKTVTLAMVGISFFSSIFIGMTNGKVETYFDKLLIKGEVVEYQKFVDAEEIYDGRKTIPPHYEKAYKFEPDDKNDWMLDVVEYSILIICFVFPFVNFKILSFANKKADRLKREGREGVQLI